MNQTDDRCLIGHAILFFDGDILVESAIGDRLKRTATQANQILDSVSQFPRLGQPHPQWEATDHAKGVQAGSGGSVGSGYQQSSPFDSVREDLTTGDLASGQGGEGHWADIQSL
jgi:hypothetical protein